MKKYSSYEELEGKILEKGDIVEFTVKDEIITYTVYSYYLATKYKPNDTIFKLLKIPNINEYAVRLYGYPLPMRKSCYLEDLYKEAWPEYRTEDYTAATKLVLDLFRLCKLVHPEGPLYKVGDVVTVKNQYDKGLTRLSYPFDFLESMLTTYGGKKVTISKVRKADKMDKGYPLYADGYEYAIKEDGELHFWSSPMFSGKAENSEVTKDFSFKDSGFSFTKKDIPKECLYHPYVIDLGLVEFSKGICPTVRSIQDAFRICTTKEVFHWFSWQKTGNVEYWFNLYKNSSFVPEDYIPTYFIEEPSEITTEYCKGTTKKPLEIPCGYEEVTLSIKKKKVYF